MVIYELFWRANCSCGWRTDVKNEPEVCVDKVKNHLLTFHRSDGAEIEISSWREQRESGRLPAMGTPVAV